MRFALIPYTKDKMHDGFFYKVDGRGKKIFEDIEMEQFWKYFYERGDEIHTIDVYSSFDEVDYFLVFHVDWEWIWKIVKCGGASKLVYCNAEPPTVMALNCPDGFKKLGKVFPYILTWNRDWTDQKRVFIRNIPYHFCHKFGDVPYEKKKLLTAITAYKKSDYKDELYSERERAYSFFEKEMPGDFVFYGVGWDKKRHPAYGGCVSDKYETYHQYKFAICLENTKNVKDYVTEKIYDCLCSGIVPIYGGASNIQEYVPQECFIDYFSFGDLEKLKKYILDMDLDTYQKYINAIDRFLSSDIQNKYTRIKYAECIYHAIEKKVPFKINISGLWMTWTMCFKQKMSLLRYRISASYKKMVRKMLQSFHGE